jgi:hypothetical protein
VAAKFGAEAAYPIRLEGDDQVAKAMEVLPQAEKLAQSAQDVRTNAVASNQTGRSGEATAERQNPN